MKLDPNSPAVGGMTVRAEIALRIACAMLAGGYGKGANVDDAVRYAVLYGFDHADEFIAKHNEEK